MATAVAAWLPFVRAAAIGKTFELHFQYGIAVVFSTVLHKYGISVVSE